MSGDAGGEEGQGQDGPFYIDGYLHKKEESWIQYWIILRGIYLLIHHGKPNNTDMIQQLLIGWIEINAETKCIMGKKRGYSFQFYVQTKTGKYLFKTNSALGRHRWVKAIKLCAQRKSPQLIPQHLTQIDRRDDDLEYPDNNAISSCNDGLVETYPDDNAISSCNDGHAETFDGEIINQEEIDLNPDFSEHDFDPAKETEDGYSSDQDFVSSKIILVSTNCASVVRNFLNSPKISVSEINAKMDEAKPLLDKEEAPAVTLNKKVSHLYHYDKQSHQQVNLAPSTFSIPKYLLSPRSLSDAGTRCRNRLTKSADSVDEMKLLTTYRSKSDTDVGGGNGRKLFSRHLINDASL